MTTSANRIVVVGATSAIAAATLKHCTAKELCLVGRSEHKLKAVRQDLTVRGAQNVRVVVADVGEPEVAAGLHERLLAEFGEFDSLIIAHGDLPDQNGAQESYEIARKALEVNFLSVVALLTPVANYMEERERGTIVVIGSVAGDRGRKSNYVYGAAKGATAVFLQGLRNRLYAAGVNVITVKPGFVDTPMTAHIKKGPLFVSADTVAAGIVRAMNRGSDVVYLPWFWLIIMTVICSIPERVFKRLSI
jgi:decaprenylphospho-beta-D-erythro-pentofuranosid-2-ulose 2-reductase